MLLFAPLCPERFFLPLPVRDTATTAIASAAVRVFLQCYIYTSICARYSATFWYSSTWYSEYMVFGGTRLPGTF